MNYQRIYEAFIADRREREAAVIESGVYVERHHITPRSLGGGDEPENLIALTAGDHFFAHLCLAKIHGGNQWMAAWGMAGWSPDGSKRELDKAWVISRKRWVALIREKKNELVASFLPRLSGADHPRRKNPEKWVEAERRFKEDNPMRDPVMRAKVGETIRARFAEPEMRSKMEDVWSDPERREAIRVSKLGDKNPSRRPEVRAKLRKAQLGRKYSAEINAKKGLASRKRVQCVETGEIFARMKDAAEAIDVNPATLSGAISKGRKTRGLTFIRI